MKQVYLNSRDDGWPGTLLIRIFALVLLLVSYSSSDFCGTQGRIQQSGTLPAQSGTAGDAQPNKILRPSYAGSPNHREIVRKALALALAAGFLDTAGITLQEIRDRLEAGAYSEDFDLIPGTVGEHYPSPWDQGPEFDFNGLYPLSKIPYGALDDDHSGWQRGYPHGYDPSTGFTWPGTSFTTIEWADMPGNAYSWSNALAFYREGKKAEAYECIGHILHLLGDLSIPEHVKVVNHGMNLASKNRGTLFDPDLATLIVDEYELALAGGVELPGVATFIPNLRDDFVSALDAADTSRIPLLTSWKSYLETLALFTCGDSLVNEYFSGPSANGQFGFFKDDSGHAIEPTQYGITPPAKLEGRWTQVAVKSTANVNTGTILPHDVMRSFCRTFVPRAVEYSAGLLLHFYQEANTAVNVAGARMTPSGFCLRQNYPNPFNPVTNISYSITQTANVSITVYNIIGAEMTVLVNERKPPGEYTVRWDASRVPTGVYFCRIQAGAFTASKLMSLVK